MIVNEDGATPCARDEPDTPLAGTDKQLVDLLTAVLVDPHLHTDTRMRLHREISEILQTPAR
jgi:hypothetical protein